MKLASPRGELAPLTNTASRQRKQVGFETARVGQGFSHGQATNDASLRNTFHSMNTSPRHDGIGKVGGGISDIASNMNENVKRPQLTKDLLFPSTPKATAFTTRNSSVQANVKKIYLRQQAQKNTADVYEQNRKKRIDKRNSQVVEPITDKDLNRIFFSRKVSEINSSADMNSTVASGKFDNIQKVRYGNKVMKQIFAKQILNREHIAQFDSVNDQTLLKITDGAYPATADGELMGRSIHTDDSMSRLVRKDGSPIKNSYIKQTRGFAPAEFNKHKFNKKITLKYDRTKFRPDFAIAPTQDGTNDESQMRSTLLSIEQSAHGRVSNKHLAHRTEEFHRPDSRPFLKDPKWPRDDIHASLRNFREKQKSPEMQLTKMHQELLDAQNKANDTSIKLEIVNFFKKNYNLALNYKLVQTMDPLHLELSFQMALMDKTFHLASLTIAACYRGIRTRRELRTVIKKRKWAISTLQMYIRRRLTALRLRKAQQSAALIVQRYCRGHLVAKHYIRERGDISIMATLKSFRDMKEEIGAQLSNLLRFYWRVYLRVKKKKAAKKKKSSKKGKKSLKQVLTSAKTMAMTMLTPKSKNSMVTPKSQTSTASKAKESPKPSAPSSTSTKSPIQSPSVEKQSKVTAQDNELSIDLTTPEGEASFSYSGRRMTVSPQHMMQQIAEVNEQTIEEEDSKEDLKVQGEDLDRAVLANQEEGQQSGLIKVHEVSILDLDKEGSLNLDQDSDQGSLGGRQKVTLDGDLGDQTQSKPVLLQQPSMQSDLERAEPGLPEEFNKDGQEESAQIASTAEFELAPDGEEEDE